MHVIKALNWRYSVKQFSDHKLSQSAQQQTFVALGNMLTSAAMMEIDTCPIGGFEPDALDRVLGLKAQQLTTTVICPIGRRDPSDKYGHYEKVRFDKNHLVMEQ